MLRTVVLGLVSLTLLAGCGASPLMTARGGAEGAAAASGLFGNDKLSPEEKALANAAYEGDAAKVEALIRQGVDVNAVNRAWHDVTPLYNAAVKGHPEVVKLLIAAGANVNYVNKSHDNRSVLAAACDNADAFTRARHLEVVRLLLSRNANKETHDSEQGLTPFMMAIGGGEYEIAELLLANRAMVDARNVSGQTALLTAVKNDSTRAAAFLLAHGANPEIKDKAGLNALTQVRSLPNKANTWFPEMKEIFRKAGHAV